MNDDSYPGQLNDAVCKLYDKAVEVGAKERMLPMSPDPDTGSRQDAEDFQQHGLGSDAWNDLADGYMRVFDMFQGYDQPDPALSDAIIASCTAARKRIEEEDKADVHKVKSKLAPYTSLALDSFRDNVVEKFPEARAQQLVALTSLEGLADSNRQIIRDKRDKALSFAEQGYKVIDGLHAGSGGADPWAVAIAVLFVAGGAVALGPASMAGVSTLLYLMGSSVSMGTALAGSDTEQVGTQPSGEISGSCVDEVLQSLDDALSQLDAEVTAGIDQMNLTADHNMDMLASDSTLFLPSPNDPDTPDKEPDIAEIDDPGAGVERST